MSEEALQISEERRAEKSKGGRERHAKMRISLVAQMVTDLPVVWETWVQSLGWEDLLEKGKPTHSSILA